MEMDCFLNRKSIFSLAESFDSFYLINSCFSILSFIFSFCDWLNYGQFINYINIINEY